MPKRPLQSKNLKTWLAVFNQQVSGQKTFLLGAALFVVLFYIMTSFVWTIEITGNEKIETQLIIEKTGIHGVKPGVLKYRINSEKVADRIIMDVNGLSYVSVVVRGTKVRWR